MSQQKFGVLGWPVTHSVSPQMQGAGFDSLGIDASYKLLPLDPGEFENGIRQLVADDFRGWNITVPHKAAMLPLLDEIDPPARLAQSVNTVLNDNGKLYGWSTDGYGLERSSREAFGVPAAGAHILFWGTGGAARATACHYAAAGAAQITLINRTQARAEALAEVLRSSQTEASIQVIDRADNHAVRTALSAAGVVVQSSSMGLKPEDPSAIPLEVLPENGRLLDMIYRPTPLLLAARERGWETADGKEMLLYQGVRSFELWTQREAPVASMRAALYAALG